MTNLTQTQIENEMLQYSLAAQNKASKIRNQIKSNQEYNTSYGKQAIMALLPIAEDYITALYGMRNQHTKRFYWNHIKPRWEAGEKPERTIAEMVAITLVSTLSKDMTLTGTSSKMAKNAFHIFNINHDERVDLEQHATQFFAIMIEYIAANTDIFVVEQVDNREYRLFLTDEWAQHIMDEQENTKTNIDSYSPMIVKPVEHTNLISGKGGYLKATSPLLKRPVKRGGKIVDGVRAFNAETAPDYFAFINKVQSTPYCVNRKLLEVLFQYYSEGMSFNDFPVDVNEDLVEIQARKEIDARNEGRKKWAAFKEIEYKPLTDGTVRKAFKDHYNKEAERARKTLALFDQAEEYMEYSSIYFPVFLDNRGRMYPYASGCLSYQGDQLAKSLLHFSNKQAITPEGVDVMFETLANTLKDEDGNGLDKRIVSEKIEKAIAWFAEHQDDLMNGDYSYFFTHQNTFEEPITALGICLELVEFIKDPEYKTGLICHRDARVSGSSIIGTALRDKNVMEMTSVIDWNEGGKLGDAYVATAMSALELCVEKAKTCDLANGLLCFKNSLFTRKVFKHVVMTFCSYGLTEHSLREYNSELIDWKEELSPKHKKVFDALMLEALAVAMPACDSYLKTIKVAGAEVAKRDGMIAFNNPMSGFPVVFSARKEIIRTIEVRQPFKLIQLKISTPTNQPDTKKMTLATAPNIIHATDASLLFLTGVQLDGDLCFIHDSMSSNVNDVHKVVAAYAKVMEYMAKTDPLNNILEQMNVEYRIPLVNTATDEDVASIKYSKHVLC